MSEMKDKVAELVAEYVKYCEWANAYLHDGGPAGTAELLRRAASVADALAELGPEAAAILSQMERAKT